MLIENLGNFCDFAELKAFLAGGGTPPVQVKGGRFADFEKLFFYRDFLENSIYKNFGLFYRQDFYNFFKVDLNFRELVRSSNFVGNMRGIDIAQESGVKIFRGFLLSANFYSIDVNGVVLLMDPGLNFLKGREFFSPNKKNVPHDACLLTHAHFDHSCGISGFDGEIAMSGLSFDYLSKTDQISTGYKYSGIVKMPEISSDEKITKLKDGDLFSFNGRLLYAISTPGHTKDSFCYYYFDEGILFTGDSIFPGGALPLVNVPRKNVFFEGCDLDSFVCSVEKLIDFSKVFEVRLVCPGHCSPSSNVLNDLQLEKKSLKSLI